MPEPLLLALIPLLPFAGFVANALLGRRLPKSVSGPLACAAMVGSFAAAVAAAFALGAGGREYLEATYYTWLPSGDLQVPLRFRLDALAVLMTLIVTGIGSLIHIYSVGYMHEETPAEYARYFS